MASKRSRNNRKGFFSGRSSLVAFVSFGAVFLLGIHVYLFRAISLHGSGSDTIRGEHLDAVNEIRPIKVTPLRDVDLELYTIRINTWQRLEQLLVSIEHHATCPGVAQIQVVWCEEKDPPQELVAYSKVVVERHSVNSLNERFRVLQETPTMGILSMDDDVLRPCEAIDSGMTNLMLM